MDIQLGATEIILFVHITNLQYISISNIGIILILTVLLLGLLHEWNQGFLV